MSARARKTPSEASGKSNYPAKGNVVIITSDKKNHALWKMQAVEDVITGQDGGVQQVKLRTPKSVMERLVQHVHPSSLPET